MGGCIKLIVYKLLMEIKIGIAILRYKLVIVSEVKKIVIVDRIYICEYVFLDVNYVYVNIYFSGGKLVFVVYIFLRIYNVGINFIVILVYGS